MISDGVFLSTPSARRATEGDGLFFMLLFYFYPRPPRGGRHSKYNDSLVGWMISIHALREEGDGRNFWRYRPTCTISIHALREEGDSAGFAGRPERKAFLSTPSARRATSFPDFVNS